jgi:GNAT superfamily N-acetyltransferase
MPACVTIRPIRVEELPVLLSLYRHLHPSDPELPINSDVERLWQRIYSDPRSSYFVADIDARVVSTCTLTVIPNLTRGAQPYGIIENVVTLPDFRRQGIGTRILQAALAQAWERGCYKVMLLTGRQDEATLRFYQQAGFEAGVKTGFVARRNDT